MMLLYLCIENQVLEIDLLCSAGSTAGCRLQDCCSDDAVQYHSKQPLAAGGGDIPAQPAGSHGAD